MDGDDWTEIAAFLGVDIENGDDDEGVAAETRVALDELRSDACKVYVDDTYPEASKRKVNEIRRFVETFIALSPSDVSLWKGLLAIDDDARFLEYVGRLLECMWV